eukprot:SAG11_NODE_2708_length_3062_cov_1.659804_2_plen_178_part_00
MNYGWASASWEQRQKIIEEHKYFELGTLYYFSHDVTGRYAAETKKRFNSYGLCADEFAANGHLPHQLYVRSKFELLLTCKFVQLLSYCTYAVSNRLVGDYVMTQNNITKPRHKPDSIGVADWNFDEHMTGKVSGLLQCARLLATLSSCLSRRGISLLGATCCCSMRFRLATNRCHTR